LRNRWRRAPDRQPAPPDRPAEQAGQIFSLAIASDSEYERTSIELLEQAAREAGLSSYLVDPHNLDETYQKLAGGEIGFRFYYDRASDTTPDFLKLYDLVVQRNIPVLDTWQDLGWAADKAFMHDEFDANGVPTPYTIIIPPFDHLEGVHHVETDLSKLGKPFVIKPANTTGGGIGVVRKAGSLQDVHEARQLYQDNKYLLQEKVIPFEKDNKRFWFRGFYVCGQVVCVWWNDLTHLYESLTDEDVRSYNLGPLFTLVRKIAAVCKLHFFSTEIAFDIHGRFVVVDYVNEVCDLRLKSLYRDGVPDEIVRGIACQIVRYVSKQTRTRIP